MFQVKTPRKNKVIGIVDLCGFESRASTNGFEQLAINYADEKLHQFSLSCSLRAEQEEYLREGVEWTPISFPDNKHICDLIERTNLGVLSLLDEVSLRRTAPGKGPAGAEGAFPFLGVSSSSEGESTPPMSGDLFLDRLCEASRKHPCLQFREQKNLVKESNGIPQHCFK